MKSWTLALRNLRRNRRRNVATAVAVALGYAGMVLFGGYISRIEAFIRTTTVYLQHTGHVSVWAKDGLEKSLARPARHSFPLEQQRRIAALVSTDPRVAFAAKYLRGMGLAGNGCRTVPFVATGVETESWRRILAHPDVLSVSPDFARPLKGRSLPDAVGVAGAVGLSEGLARRLGKPRTHDEVGTGPVTLVLECGGPDAASQIAADANIQLAGMTFDGSLSALDGEIVNLFQTPTAETNDQTVLTTLGLLQDLYATDAVTYVALFLHDHREAETVANDLRTRLASEGIAADVFSFNDNRVNPYYVGSMAFLGSMLVFIGALVTSVVVLGILNTATLTVYERTREIGTLRALGWRRRQVASLFMREGTLLALVGVVGGVLLSTVIASAVNAANIRFRPPGIPGEVQLVLWPSATVHLAVAGLLLPLLTLVTWLVARRRAREGTADLLTATTT